MGHTKEVLDVFLVDFLMTLAFLLWLSSSHISHTTSFQYVSSIVFYERTVYGIDLWKSIYTGAEKFCLRFAVVDHGNVSLIVCIMVVVSIFYTDAQLENIFRIMSDMMTRNFTIPGKLLQSFCDTES